MTSTPSLARGTGGVTGGTQTKRREEGPGIGHHEVYWSHQGQAFMLEKWCWARCRPTGRLLGAAGKPLSAQMRRHEGGEGFSAPRTLLSFNTAPSRHQPSLQGFRADVPLRFPII
ncbi:unnamed protein product [Pleuronectes platessa]|uniref:Uncharacterized protein n=1 Tax=Pleuronectes platessa TaxID=8262 RepID=A0A9N7U5I6_PLEPL|nr:unnamed protein product [Pleuronectes platessa]